MNVKEIAEWIEDRGELMLMKKDGEGFVIAARSPDGMWKTAEAETLARAITLSDRHVWRILKQADKEAEQENLF